MMVCCVGKLNVDLLFSVRSVKLGENHVSNELVISVGGKATNVAVALSKLGVEVHLMAAIGDDPFGNWAWSELQKFGSGNLKCHLERLSNERTGTTLVLVEGLGRNTMFNFLGANAKLRSAHIERHVSLLSSADLIYVQAGLDESIYGLILSLGKPTFLELTEPNPWMSSFTYVSLNLEEALRLTGGRNVEETLDKLTELRLGKVFLKLGEKGSAFLSFDRLMFARSFSIEPVDSTGAGDAFSACCIYGLLSGWPVERTLEFANACGALTCLKFGTAGAFPTLDEVERFLSDTVQRNI